MKKEDHECLFDLGFILVEQSTEDLYWLYSLSLDGTELRLSWSLTEDSMQTAMYRDGVALCKVSSERLTFSQVTNEGITAKFDLGNSVTTLEIRIKSQIHVEWSTLRT
jgi:hypothetical protein